MARVSDLMQVGFTPNQAKLLGSSNIIAISQNYAGTVTTPVVNPNDFVDIPNLSFTVNLKIGDAIELFCSIRNSHSNINGNNEFWFFKNSSAIGIGVVEEAKKVDLLGFGNHDISCNTIIDVATQDETATYKCKIKRGNGSAGVGYVGGGIMTLKHYSAITPI